MADRIVLMVGGKLAASDDYRAIRLRLNERAYLVRVDCDQPRVLVAGLVSEPMVQSVSIEDDTVRVLSLDVRALQRAIPVVAQAHSVRLSRVEPLDDTLESGFSYLADTPGGAAR
jgi:ABC-2 type transport system ATP-binding protein